MKTKFFVAAVLAAALLFAGCATTPMQGSNVVVTAHTNFEVLGRVTVESRTDRSGFVLLMDEAKRLYPEADDIINILVDGKKGLFKDKYIMSAVVIKYVSPAATAQ